MVLLVGVVGSADRTLHKLQFVDGVAGAVAEAEKEVFFTAAERADGVAVVGASAVAERHGEYLHFQSHLLHCLHGRVGVVASPEHGNVETALTAEVGSLDVDDFVENHIGSA